MTRAITATLIAAATTAGLLLTTACGSDSGDSDEAIEGVDEGGDEQENDASAAPTPEGVERPTIEFPDGWENVWEDWESSDPVEQTILADVRGSQDAIDLAILERDPDSENVDFYNDADALHAAREWISGFIENERTIAGTVRYFDPTIERSGNDGQAVVSYCADESDAQAVDVDSGEPLDDDIDQQQVSYRATVQQDDRGVWVTVSLVADREECGP